MKRRSQTKSKSKQSALLLSGIALTGLTLGGMATHLYHVAGSKDMTDAVEILTEEDRNILRNHHAEMEKVKQAHLEALETEDKWYDEISKTQRVRAEMKVEKKMVLEKVKALEAEKAELIALQELAIIEKRVASEAVVRSIQAKTNAENHALNAYETTQQARAKLKQAKTDQEKADAVINQFEKLEKEIQVAKRNFAVLDAKYQIALKENNRLAVLANQPKHEVVVVNNTPPVNHIHHETIIDNSGPAYCPPTSPTTPNSVFRPQPRPQPKCPPTPCPAPVKHKRFR